MMMDTRIPLMGQTPDIMGQFGRGMDIRQGERDNQHQNAFRSMLQQQGAGIMQGDQNALAQLAQFDPQAALGVQESRQGMEVQREQLQMARAAASRAAAQWAQTQDAASIARERETLERALAMGTQAQTPQQWDQVMTQLGATDYVGQFGQRNMLIAGALGVRDALTMGQGPEFRPASPEEAARYGVPGGQVGPDGRFYPITPPSGTSVRTNPDGTVEFLQGAGVAQRPFTEAQSRDNVYSTRARGALESFEPVADALMSRPEILAESVPLGLARGTQSPEFQQALVAGTEFLQAILRKDTGAAITTQEREEYGRVYLPQPGDTPEVLTMRRQARQRALAALESGMTAEQIAAQTRALGAAIGRASGGAAPQATPRVDMAPGTPAPTPRAAGGEPQRGATPQAIMQMPFENLMSVDVMSLDAEGLRALEQRFVSGQ